MSLYVLVAVAGLTAADAALLTTAAALTGAVALGSDRIVSAAGKAVDKVTKVMAALRVAISLTTATPPPDFEPEKPPQKQEQPKKATETKPDAGGGGEPPKGPKGSGRVGPDGIVRVSANP